MAALAYGVEGMPRVDKIVGPGNLFVALAKKFVFGEVDIDSIAGPSEVVVHRRRVDAGRLHRRRLDRPGRTCAGGECPDYLEQTLLDATAGELARQLAHLERGDLARQSLEQFGALILAALGRGSGAPGRRNCPRAFAHRRGRRRAAGWKIPHAGAAFLGNYSPVAVGDYVAGPSHVLPTGGTARFASGLSANDFLRGSSVIPYTRRRLAGRRRRHPAAGRQRRADAHTGERRNANRKELATKSESRVSCTEYKVAAYQFNIPDPLISIRQSLAP